MVLTRSASVLSSEPHNMPTTSAGETRGTNASTTTTIAVTAGTSTFATTSASTVVSAAREVAYTQPDSEVSLSSNDMEQTIRSPDFSSITAQSIRQQIREGISNQQVANGKASNDNIRELVEASVGLYQARFMREVDSKIQTAMEEIKQLLSASTLKPVSNVAPAAVPEPQIAPMQPQQPLGYVPRVDENQHKPTYVATEQRSATFAQLPSLIPAPAMISTPQGLTVPQRSSNVQRPQPQMAYQQSEQCQTSSLPRNNTFRITGQSVQMDANQIFQPPAYHRLTSNLQPEYPPENWAASAHQRMPPQQPVPPAQSVPSYHLPMSTPYRPEMMDKFKLDKWGVKFDGTSKTMNVQEFIFRVSALQMDYGVTDGEILRSFHLLLEGPALDWYWDYRKIVNIRTWQELESALLSQYRRFEQEHQVQMKILNRRQLPHEPFEDFYNAVIKLRNQQTSPYREEQLVEIMRGNLKPSLAQMLFSVKLSTLSDFCREVRRAENLIYNQRQMYQQRTNMPQRVNELGYTGEEFVPIGLEVDGIRATSHYTCWNCRKVGHSFVDCPEPITRQFCFRCGKEGVVAPKCPNCQGNRAKYPSRTGETGSTNV